MPRILAKSKPGAPAFSARMPRGPATGKRGIRRLHKVDVSKGITMPEANALGVAEKKATLTTALTGANNDLVFTSRLRGEAGNRIRIRYVVAGASTALSVAISAGDIDLLALNNQEFLALHRMGIDESYDITVNVATDGASAATSTATQVKAALDAHAQASVLLSTALAPGNSGAGVVTAMAYTSLTGGVLGDNMLAGPGTGAAAASPSILRKARNLTTGDFRSRIRDRSTNRTLTKR